MKNTGKYRVNKSKSNYSKINCGWEKESNAKKVREMLLTQMLKISIANEARVRAANLLAI